MRDSIGLTPIGPRSRAPELSLYQQGVAQVEPLCYSRPQAELRLTLERQWDKSLGSDRSFCGPLSSPASAGIRRQVVKTCSPVGRAEGVQSQQEWLLGSRTLRR